MHEQENYLDRGNLHHGALSPGGRLRPGSTDYSYCANDTNCPSNTGYTDCANHSDSGKTTAGGSEAIR